jgi:hypothetical protein
MVAHELRPHRQQGEGDAMTFDLMNLNFGRVTTAEARAYLASAREGMELYAKMGQPVAPDSMAAWGLHMVESLCDQLDEARSTKGWSWTPDGALTYHPESEPVPTREGHDPHAG